MHSQISQCRICGNRNLVEVLDLGEQALTGVFPRSRSQPVSSGPLRLVKCHGMDACDLVQLQHTYDASELYGSNYGYRSGLNPSMVRHLQQRVQNILARIEIAPNDLVVDIGSNDATTLRAYPAGVGTLVGIDPSGAKFKRFYPAGVRLIPDFFSPDVLRSAVGDRKARVVTSFSMLYDLDDPTRFVRDIAEVLSDDGLWVSEQSYLPTMLAQNSYDTVCHEHVEYYSLRQIQWMTERAGLVIVDVEFNDINGGSFVVFAAKRASGRVPSPAVAATIERETRLELGELHPYGDFARRVAGNRDELRRFVLEARRRGRTVAGLGASTKGNVILQYCGFTEADISRIGEVNDDKFGSFTPGSLIPIVPEQELLNSRPDLLLVLPWHFRRFFEANPTFAGHRLVYPLPVLQST